MSLKSFKSLTLLIAGLVVMAIFGTIINSFLSKGIKCDSDNDCVINIQMAISRYIHSNRQNDK